MTPYALTANAGMLVVLQVCRLTYGVPMNSAAIIEILRVRIPDLFAIYAFGSRIHGTAGPDSDLDFAVLVAGYAEPLGLFDLAADLADVAGCAVDLLDLRAARSEEPTTDPQSLMRLSYAV